MPRIDVHAKSLPRQSDQFAALLAPSRRLECVPEISVAARHVSDIACELKALQNGDGQPSDQKAEDSRDQAQRNEKTEDVEFGM